MGKHKVGSPRIDPNLPRVVTYLDSLPPPDWSRRNSLSRLDLLRVMASDWNESTVRNLGTAIFGGSGQGVRARFLAKTIAAMVAATELAHYALGAHPTVGNQPPQPRDRTARP